MTLHRRNELYEALSYVGFEMTDFAFEHDSTSAKVAHRPTGSTFAVSEQPHGFAMDWQVTDGPRSDLNEACKEWDDVFPVAHYWAGDVKYVSDNPDFWEELRKISAALAPMEQREEVAGAPFSAEERAEISQRMEEVRKKVRATPELTAAQVEAVEQVIDDLNESAEKVTRKDWRLLLYGQAVNLFFAYAIPPHVVQGIIITAITGLGHMFGLGGLPPSLPPQA